MKSMPLIALCALLALSLTTILTEAQAQPIPEDAIAIVTDASTLERQIPDSGLPFQAFVVFLNPTYGKGSVGAAQFGIELDPGLELIAANSEGLVLEPGPLDYIISYPNCLAESTGDPFVLMTLVIEADGTQAPGAGVRLRALPSIEQSIQATRCGSDAIFSPIDFGGISTSPATPAALGFINSPAYPVEGRTYRVHWETLGGGDWRLDEGVIEPRGQATFEATSDRAHVLTELGTGVREEIAIDVIREPQLLRFEQRPTADPDEIQISWEIVGAALASVSGYGWVNAQGTILVNRNELPVVELSASNEWGSLWHSVELVASVDPPVIESFTMDPPEFSFGQAVLLEYVVHGATELRLDPEFGRIPIDSSSHAITPTAATLWTLTATNSAGTVTAELDVDLPVPNIRKLGIVTSHFRPGDPIEIEYDVLGANEAWFNEGEFLPLPSGTVELVAPDSVETWTLSAQNARGLSTQELPIAPAPPLLDVHGDQLFDAGERVRINWTVSWADELTLYPGAIPLSPQDGGGQVIVYPDSTTTYRLVARNLGGTTTKTHLATERGPNILGFDAQPREAFVGDPITFSWDVRSATAMEIWDANGKIDGIDLPPDAPDSGSIVHTFTEPFVGPVELVVWGSLGARRSGSIDLKIWPWRDLIQTFHAAPPTVDDISEPTTLRWEAEPGTTCWIEPGGGTVNYFGSRIASLEERISYWVFHAQYASHVQTDTAWAVAQPLSSFTVDTDTVQSGDTVVLTYSAPGADRVVINPGIGEVPAGGGQFEMVVSDATTFEFNAWYAGEREVIERPVSIFEARIETFRFSDNWIDTEETVMLEWSVVGAQRVIIEGPGFPSRAMAHSATLEVPPGSYGLWSIRVEGHSSNASRSMELHPPYDPPGSIVIAPEIALPGDPVTLRWDIPDAYHIDIIGHGRHYGAAGEYEFAAGPMSETLEIVTVLRYRPSVYEWTYHCVPLRVDVEDRPPTLHLSWDPTSIVPEPPSTQATAQGETFGFYVHGHDMMGPIEALEFSIDIPAWLEVTAVQPFGREPISASGPDFALSFDGMEFEAPYAGELARIEVQVIGTPEPGTGPEISIREDVPARWHTGLRHSEFGFGLPALPIDTGMAIDAPRQSVPILALPLDYTWRSGGLDLSWNELPDASFARIELLRGRDFEAPASILVIGSERTWTDRDAARLLQDGPIHYQLVANTEDGRIWRSPLVQISTGPPPSLRPARTRLVGAVPNPFNPQTSIRWELAEPGPVQIGIYDVAGRLVREWNLPGQPWGEGSVIWDGTDRRGSRTASGVYLIRLRTNGVVDTRRATLVK